MEDSGQSPTLSEGLLMNERKFNRKRRGHETRTRKPIVFVAVEGRRNKTERYYLKALVEDCRKISIKIVPDSSTDAVGMAESLVLSMNENDFSSEGGDLAFCLIDQDCLKEKDSEIAKAERIAKQNGFQLIVSNPCFELWFLCHFIKSPKKYFSGDELNKDLKRYLPGYSKSDNNVYMRVRDKLDFAIESARRLEQRGLENGNKIHTADLCPSTEVYKIIDALVDAGYCVDSSKNN